MPKIDPDIITEVTQFFGTDQISFASFNFGENSNAYSFSVNNQRYVLGVSLSGRGFEIDRLISKLIQDPAIPIPETVLTGKHRDNHFSVTFLVPGKLMIDEDDNTQLSLMNGFLKVTHAFHTYTPTSPLSGFGPINPQGNGQYSTWESFITDQTPVQSSFWPAGYFEKLHKLKLSNFVNKIKNYGLIHGDYGYKNVIANKDKITGIIDWEDAKFGDFVYDIAYIHFWASQTDFQKIFYNYYQANSKLDMAKFKNRFDCYTLYIGISLLNYFATKKDSDSFDWIRQKIDLFLGLNNL